ncbi:hypothetical protein HY441_00475 [Candidatus Microgenomates bacterium]|nr:hypothetical protein [Candidatus Microgenomates bacterium]
MSAKASTKKAVVESKQVSLRTLLKRLFSDKLFIGFLLTGIGLTAASVVMLLLKVRPRDFVVPLQYSTLQGFDALGAWYRVYAFGVFSLVVTIGNILLAAMSYDKSRIGSFFLVVGTVIVNLFTLTIIFTLVGHLEF